MEACHSCRNRHCVNPEHLREDTRTANQRDRVKDGTDNRGERSARAKLSEQNVLDIFNSNKSKRELSEEYGVSYSSIRDIKNGMNWGWLTTQ